MRIQCQHISKVFKNRNGGISALENVSFETKENEFLCILGPSGCGKTTLLRILAGLLEPTSGKVTYERFESSNNQATALVFQEHGIFPWMNVMDNVCFGVAVKGIHKKDKYTVAMSLIERMHLAGFVRYYPHQLSSGMKQRVGLARALISGANVLLMDEPFASVDAQMRAILQQEILEIQKEFSKSIIYVTHDIDEAVLLADRVILMTARPGSVKDEINIDVERPRNIDGQHAREIVDIRSTIWRQIKEEVEKKPFLPEDEITVRT
jgi:NitT/TauT family transport system ATP-binding protein